VLTEEQWYVLAVSQADRFWSHVDKSAGPDGCWPWKLGKDKDGYGKFAINTRVNGVQVQKHVKAHSHAWSLANGKPWPKGKLCLHSCDNPPCCNPEHATPGTQLENRRDCKAKGRTATKASGTHMSVVHPETLARGERHWCKTHPEKIKRGEKHPNSKATPEIVKAIRAEYIPRKNVHELAARYGLNKDTVVSIAMGRSWKHVNVEVPQ
jgi:hypothetical protein